MKAGDLFMVQFCAEHGSFRVLPLRTCEDLARVDLSRGVGHGWVVVGHALSEGEALDLSRGLRGNVKREDGYEKD